MDSSSDGSTVHFTVDPRLSRFTVQAFPGGFLSVFAHSPKFGICDLSCDIQVDPADPGTASLRMEIRADSLQLAGDVNDHDRREIERVMRDEALEAKNYPP